MIMRAPSEKLLAYRKALDDLSYQDFIGMPVELMEHLIGVYELRKRMLEVELESRRKFAVPVKQPHKADNGSYM